MRDTCPDGTGREHAFVGANETNGTELKHEDAKKSHVIGPAWEQIGPKRAMAARCMLLLSSASALSLPAAAPVVVLGPGSLDLRLLTAKLAARSGLQTSLFSASGGVQDIWREQMYGVEDGSTDIANSAEPLRPAMVADADEREAALAAAEGLAIISDGVAMPEAALSSVLAVSPQLKRIVCLSKMGVTRATAGPLGFGKEMVEQLEAEVTLVRVRVWVWVWVRVRVRVRVRVYRG